MRFAVAVVMLVVGCNHDERCRKAAADVPSKRLATRFERLCIEDDWSKDAIACLQKGPSEVPACLKSELGASAYARVKTAIDSLF